MKKLTARLIIRVANVLRPTLPQTIVPTTEALFV